MRKLLAVALVTLVSGAGASYGTLAHASGPPVCRSVVILPRTKPPIAIVYGQQITLKTGDDLLLCGTHGGPRAASSGP